MFGYIEKLNILSIHKMKWYTFTYISFNYNLPSAILLRISYYKGLVNGYQNKKSDFEIFEKKN